MKAITIKQPYASLIAAGIKTYEFRTWKTKYRGELLIHAGKSVDKKAVEKFKKYNLEYPTGCIIAKVNLDDCVLIDNEMKKKLLKENDLIYENVCKSKDIHYGFKLSNVKKIKKIYINGKLSLWDYNN